MEMMLKTNGNGEKMKHFESNSKEFGVQHAERLFALRNFRESLKVANDMMILFTTIPINDNNGGGEGGSLECEREAVLTIDFSNISLVQKQRHRQVQKLKQNNYQSKLQDSLNPLSSHGDTSITATMTTATTDDQHDDNEGVPSLFLTRVCIVPQCLLMLNTLAPSNRRTNSSHSNVNKEKKKKMSARTSVLRDRAAAIALQSSYELWKERRDHRRHRYCRRQLKNPEEPRARQFGGTMEEEEEEEEELTKLIQDLRPFFRLYHNHLEKTEGIARGDRKEAVTTMSWDLAILWIKFCNALGYTDAVFSSLIEMLHGLIRWEEEWTKTMMSQKHNHHHAQYDRGQQQHLIKNEWRNQLLGKDNAGTEETEKDIYLHQSYYELCHLLLVDKVIYVKDIAALECITDRIFLRSTPTSVLSLLHQRITIATAPNTGDKSKNNDDSTNSIVGKAFSAFSDHRTKEAQQFIELSSEPVRESMRLLCQHIEAIYGRGERHIEMELLVNLAAGETDHCKAMLMLTEALEDCLDDIREGEKETVMIEKKEICSDILCNDNENYERYISNQGRNDNKGNHIKNYLVDLLWTSEDRWINRGRFVTASFITYNIWRRWKRVLAIGRGVGHVLISPLREILDALKSK